MFKSREPKFKITESGKKYLERVRDSTWNIPIPLILMHLGDNPSGAYLDEFEDCSVNAKYLLEDLCKKRYVERV